MSDIMRPVPFKELLVRIFSELKKGSIFEIKKENFYKANKSYKLLNKMCSTVVGPAAGPHTQLAQNIIASYLCGGRFIELKTVQIMDELEISKPCIDARDEGYNVEWSSEYTLLKSRDEYYKAWIICNLLNALLNNGKVEEPDFIFNMSVGYNLEGIKNPRMQEFIDKMMDASKDVKFEIYLQQLDEFIKNKEYLKGTIFEGIDVYGIGKKISANICSNVTISTMHGCPPDEIESIAKYMLEEKKLDTYVKLNPTLLGYDRARSILDNLGYSYITLKRETFEHDLQYKDALKIITSLRQVAKENKKKFGIKLTNTLANVNDHNVLSGDECYASGRVLYPLAVTLASDISSVFNGDLPISYSGGVNAFTVKGLFEAGIRPLTLATDMLHPGGYNKLKQIAEVIDNSKESFFNKTEVNVEKVTALSKEALSSKFIKKSFRGEKSIKIKQELPLVNCYIAPCEVACPVHQSIPEYIRLTKMNRFSEAVDVLYQYNVLPTITCYLCDHKCQYNCNRIDYEGKGVNIREVKRIAVEHGISNYRKTVFSPLSNGVKVAVVGAGPAGLASAIFLRRNGFDVEVFEKEQEAGGTVKYVIPNFRISREAIENDVNYAVELGVKFNFGIQDDSVKVSALKEKGFNYIFYAVGCTKERYLPGEGSTKNIINALKFLRLSNENNYSTELGENVVVVGAGNTAMDAARSAMKTKGVKSVTVVYRRSISEMPASKEEYEDALKEGVVFKFLSYPKFFDMKKLECTKMALGEKDSKGRRVAVPTDETFTLPCNSIIAAIGEEVDISKLKSLELPVSDETNKLLFNKETLETYTKGVYVLGDMATGASSIISAVGTAYNAVKNLSKELNVDFEQRKNILSDSEDERISSSIKRAKVYDDICSNSDIEIMNIESERCMNCSMHCERCTDVCPNRANITIKITDPEFKDLFNSKYQTVHLDAYCNECGNCAAFCPYEKARPYKDKFTVFSKEEDIRNSTNDGFYKRGNTLMVRQNGKAIVCNYNDGKFDTDKLYPIYVALIKTIIKDYSYLLTKVDD